VVALCPSMLPPLHPAFRRKKAGSVKQPISP